MLPSFTEVSHEEKKKKKKNKKATGGRICGRGRFKPGVKKRE